ncbi:visual pigment-like receptor peropsin [Amphiura filiformis]|uniref:visual pigment-like receptor peropsin n=1 Tax=Amphiura filiformis TaxID=82378 RepID=UPI003B20E8D8
MTEENETIIPVEIRYPIVGPGYEHISSGIVKILLLVLGISENVGICFMFARYKQLRSPSNCLLLHLAIANLGLCLAVMPISTVTSFYGYWIYGDAGCTYYGFAGMWFGLAIIGVLTLLGIDRYIVICRASLALQLKYLHYCFLAVVVWSYAFLWAIFPVFGWASYGLEPHDTGCGVNWLQNDASFISYVLSLTAGCFILPILIMSFCYWKAKSILYAVSAMNSASTNEDNISALNADWANQQEITKLGLALVIFFLFAWSPYAVINLWAAFGDPERIPYLLAVLAPLMAKSTVVVNPLLVVMISKKFRSYARMVVRCESPPGEDLTLEIGGEMQDATLW